MNLDIILAETFNYKYLSGIMGHNHWNYQLQFVYSGAGEAIINDSKLGMNVGDIIIVKKGNSHQFRATHKEGMKTLEIKFLTTDAKIIEQIEDIQNITNISERSFSMELFMKIIRERKEQKINFCEISQCSLYELLLTMGRYSKKTVEQYQKKDFNEAALTVFGDPIIENVNKYILENIDKKVSIDQLAKSCGYNRDYLGRLIKEKTGLPVTKYVNQLKIEQAVKYIKFSELNITQISYNLGYSDIQYFSRLFKNYIGICPKEYLNKSRYLDRQIV